MKQLWSKGIEPDAYVQTFTVGKDQQMDIYLAPYDVLGSIAHARMLQTIGLLTHDELLAITPELVSIYHAINKGEFVIEEGVEDVHSQIELMLTRKLGDIGKKIHSGRSRNDQVLLDLRLFMRDALYHVVQEVGELFNLLISKSEQHKDVLIPGYTHLQVAMPSSFGLWFGAYAESLSDDLLFLHAAYKMTNQNPLGSAAGYGNSFPLNRTLTTELLGFDNLAYNVVYAQMGRGKTEKAVANGLASVAATISKMAMDATLFMNQNFGFISFPDKLTTGSSIMPHKKNPDVLELIRAKGNKLQSLPNEISLVISNLPSGYHRDMQLLKESVLPAFGDLIDAVRMLRLMMENISVKENILQNEMYKYIFSVEEVNKLTLQGVPFRDAYKQIGMMIENGTFDPQTDVEHTHEGSIGNLCNDKIMEKFIANRSQFNYDKVERAVAKLLQ